MSKPLQLLVLLLLLTLLGCTTSEKDGDDNHQVSDTTEDAISTVKTQIAGIANFDYLIQSTGKIKALHEQNLTAMAAGMIKFSAVDNGAYVKKGQVLIQLDTQALLLKIAKVKENIFNSRLNYESDLLSQESLLRDKSRGVRDTVSRKLRASTSLSENVLTLQELEIELRNSTITAPFSGKVANAKVQKGTSVRTGDELITVYTPENLILEASILESDITFVKQGQLADIIAVAGYEKYKAKVYEINPIVNDNGLVNIKLQLLETKGLIPGMNAIAIIKAPEHRSLILPKSAIVMHDGKAVVFTDEHKVAKWNYVVLGRDNGREVEITEGIKAGQKVIVNNNLQLAQDSPIKEE